MTDRTPKDRIPHDRRPTGGTRGSGSGRWAGALWAAAVFAVLAGLPAVAADRLPDRVATHWGGRTPDGSMPLWLAAAAPALVWAALVLAMVAARRRAPAAARAWSGAGLPATGVLLAGAQASIVRANLDRADWHRAGPVGTGVAVTLVAALAAGLLGLLVTRRTAHRPPSTGGVVEPAVEQGAFDLPEGVRLAWFARTANPWLQLTAAVTGLVPAAALAAAACGITGFHWAVVVPFAIVSPTVLVCSSVQARVTGGGLAVAFGPLGWPVRRWPVGEVVAARAEDRSPAQVGGWGYRLSGKGTTVMLRAGSCLVVTPRKGPDFAVSVDDAERAAALLNSLAARGN
ncbi:DUF1648 domain-containing protein [Streptomyces sp. NPDC089919]|uniref:DUF1648 domain-containing protein n=1 Tax=Streptomyces sp. NPDC089919 TaxID=3155188 RepID=UPI00341E3CF2